MTAVIFSGLQGSGKSTYFARHFADTHVRLNRDMLRTQTREDVLLHACLATLQPFVVDNTNPTPTQRRRYATLAKAAGFRVIGYYFDVPLDACLARNALRPEATRVPDVGVRGTAAKLVVPTRDEGFDELFRVACGGEGGAFTTEEMP